MGETKAKLIKNEQPIAQGPRARGRRDAPVRTHTRRIASPARARGGTWRRAWIEEGSIRAPAFDSKDDGDDGFTRTAKTRARRGEDRDEVSTVAEHCEEAGRGTVQDRIRDRGSEARR